MQRYLRIILLVSAFSLSGFAEVLAEEGPRPQFKPIFVYVDAGDKPLAAYQIEISASGGMAHVVGIEGGEHSAFRVAPYYDPAALKGGRVIVAAFSTAKDLPRGKTRVATVHMREDAAYSTHYEAKLIVAASTDGERIPATVSLDEGGTP